MIQQLRSIIPVAPFPNFWDSLAPPFRAGFPRAENRDNSGRRSQSLRNAHKTQELLLQGVPSSRCPHFPPGPGQRPKATFQTRSRDDFPMENRSRGEEAGVAPFYLTGTQRSGLRRVKSIPGVSRMETEPLFFSIHGNPGTARVLCVSGGILLSSVENYPENHPWKITRKIISWKIIWKIIHGKLSPAGAGEWKKLTLELEGSLLSDCHGAVTWDFGMEFLAARG